LKVHSEILKANLEALGQGLSLLTSINNEQYVKVCDPYVKSHIGEHMRHVLDMYYALRNEEKNGLVDYDCRRRGAGIEDQRELAIAEIQACLHWFEALNDDSAMLDMEKEIIFKSEVRLKESRSVNIKSTMLREFVFVSSHTVHHYALIGVIAKLQNIEIDKYFGVAAATVSHLRNEVACAQ